MRPAAAVLAVLLATRISAAGDRDHFVCPSFLRVEASLEAPPEMGRDTVLRVRGSVAGIPSLEASLDVALPQGMRLAEGALHAKQVITAAAPAQWRLIVRSERAIEADPIVVRARALYPLDAVKEYFHRRLPLYGERAREELRALVRAPPARLDAVASIPVSVTAEEARLGPGPPPPAYVEAGYALESMPCSGSSTAAWRTLLEQLQAGKLPDPDGWCRLDALAALELRQGKPRVATGVWRQMLQRLAGAPGFLRHRDALSSRLAVGLAILGRTEDARAEWKKLDATPLAAHAWFDIGVSFEASGDRPGAVAAYRAALARSPGYTRARERVRALERKSGSG